MWRHCGGNSYNKLIIMINFNIQTVYEKQSCKKRTDDSDSIVSGPFLHLQFVTSFWRAC